jgi:hypothetical protein
MHKNQKRNTLIIFILAIIILASISSFGYYFCNKNKQEVNKKLNQQGLSKSGQIKNEDKETAEGNLLIKKINATEIIKNDWCSDCVTFWTEAECPYSNKKYEYEVPDDYYISAAYCPENEIGTHGGCPNCVMSKITLKKKSDNNNYSQLIGVAPTITNFCSKFDGYFDMHGQYVNADLDQEKELIVFCDGFIHRFAVLDNQNNKWITLTQNSDGWDDNYLWSLKPVTVKDYNNDGIDEISYAYSRGTINFSMSAYFLHSFRDKKWFTCIKTIDLGYSPDGSQDLAEFKCGYCPNGNEDEFIENKNNPWIYSEDKETWINN